MNDERVPRQRCGACHAGEHRGPGEGGICACKCHRQWPPERVWIEQAADYVVALDRPDRSDQPAYVPEERLAEVERERDLAIDASKVAGKILGDAIRERKAAEAERDALREENERLRIASSGPHCECGGLLGDVPCGTLGCWGCEALKRARKAEARVRELEARLQCDEAAIPKHDADCIRRGDGRPTSLCTCGLTDEQVRSAREPRPDTSETCSECEGMRDTSGRIAWTCPSCGGTGRRYTTSEEDR